MESILNIHNGSYPRIDGYARFVCISDTHSRPVNLPEGDVLLHAGDFTKKGTQDEVLEFARFLKRAPFAYKVIIAGNHDAPFDIKNYSDILHKKRDPISCDPIATKRLLKDFIYLEDSLAVVAGYKI